MARIREQFKHREICPNRVWLILEMVGLTICYKSDYYHEVPCIPEGILSYLGAGRLDVTKISLPFHQYHFRDQHKLNSGTEFLFGWATVTTRNFRSFSIPTIHYSSVTIHRLLFTGHYSSFYYSSFLDSVCDSEKRYYSHDTIHPERNYYSWSLFMSSPISS